MSLGHTRCRSFYQVLRVRQLLGENGLIAALRGLEPVGLVKTRPTLRLSKRLLHHWKGKRSLNKGSDTVIIAVQIATLQAHLFPFDPRSRADERGNYGILSEL